MRNSPYRKMWIYGIRKLMLFLFQKKRKSENENPVVAFVHQQVERDSASGSVRVPVAAAQPAAVVAVEPVTPVRVADPVDQAEDRADSPRGDSCTPCGSRWILRDSCPDPLDRGGHRSGRGGGRDEFSSTGSPTSQLFRWSHASQKKMSRTPRGLLIPAAALLSLQWSPLCPRRARRHGIRLPSRSGTSGTRLSPDCSRCPRRRKKKFLRPPRSPTALFEGLRRESGILSIQSPRNPQRRVHRRRRTRRRSLRSPSRRTPAGAPSPRLSAP